MAVPCPRKDHHSHFNPLRPIMIGLSRVLAGAACGYLGARLFTALNPLTGCAFGAVYGIIGSVSQPIFARLLNEENSKNQTCSNILSIITTAVLTNLILAAMTGVALTSGATIGLMISCAIASILIELAIRAAIIGGQLLSESCMSQ